MDLALQCGVADFRPLLDLPASVIELWKARYIVDPWGEERADLRAAMLTARVYNALREKTQAAYSLHDFMPYSDRPPPPAEEELAEKLMAAFGFAQDGSQLPKGVIGRGRGSHDCDTVDGSNDQL